MAVKRDLLEKMRANPRADWTIANVKTLCSRHGIEVRRPSGSSHYVLSSPYLRDSLTVPFKRPIKALYIKHLVSYCDGHNQAKEAISD